MSLAVNAEGLALEGPVFVSGAQAQAKWSKKFGPSHAGQSDISGNITLNQPLLDAFNIALPEDMISGAAQGTLDVALRKGRAPAFTITSNLAGMRMSLPAIGASKAGSRQGGFKITGTAGDVPKVTELSVEFAGLSAKQGRVELEANGGLKFLAFDELKVGNWLNSSVNLIGQGKGQPVKIRLGGGTMDLAKAPFGSGGGTSGSTGGSNSPVELVLDRFDITDTLSLHGMSATLSQRGGLSGTFKGRLNGSAPISGTISAGQYGPTIQVTAQDAGRAVVAAGLLEEAAGGDLSLTLISRGGEHSFDGTAKINDIKVQSAPELAELLSLVSVVGLLEQLSGPGIFFSEIHSRFTILPDRIEIGRSTAEGPSLGISAEGRYHTKSETFDIEGVISPIYFLNAIGQVVSKKGEGLFGFNFDLNGTVDRPKVSVNPLSLLTPGALRGIFRKKATSPETNEAPAQ
jgi:hypothetical protein